jgi:hypothetical protein
MNLNQVTLPALDQTVRELQARGIAFTQEPRDEPWLWRVGPRSDSCAPAPDRQAP